MFREQLEGLDAYLKLSPNGESSERVRLTREVVQKLVANSSSPN